MSKVKLINLVKKFDNKKILNNINLKIEEGELVSLLGPSGCGKSTTLKLIAGLIKADGGDILFNEESVLNVDIQKRGAVIVFQDYLLFPHMNIYDNIDFGLKIKKEKKEIRKEKVNNLISLVKLEGMENKYPSELSGGQKQRVAIARALAVKPEILLLDEPFSNLDIILRDEMREFVLEIQKKLNITTILVTHDKEEALMMSDKVAIMLDGEIKQFDSPKVLYTNPSCIEVADFFGERNYIMGTVKENVLISDIGEFKVNYKDTDKIRVMISPENIAIHTNLDYTFNDSNKITGKIIKKRYGGDRTYYTVSAKSHEFKITSSNDNYNVDDEVNICIDFNNSIYYTM